MIPASNAADQALAKFVAQFYADPLGWVIAAYPWGKEGTTLANEEGPDVWQAEILAEIGKLVKQRNFNGKDAVAPIRVAISSGHGVGKSTLAAWLVDWLMSTRPDAQGTITANTFTQLETKTWAQIQKWTKLCITGHWFHITGDRMYFMGRKESWFASAQSCKEENSEAFAGQHAANSSSFYLADEASAIPDSIFEVMEGGLTDGEPFIFFFGNPTKNNGKFHRVCFGGEKARWLTRCIDSRTSKKSNKSLIEEWAHDWGEDSDFFRVRVLGIPPRASDSQFIDQQRVLDAQKRSIIVLPDEPLIVGVDFAWGGADYNVVRFRKGLDARSIKPIRIPGEQTREPHVMIGKLAEVLDTNYNGKQVDMMFVDSAGMAGQIVPRLRELGHRNVIEVNFGADAPNQKYANMRSYMWGNMRDWLVKGMIDNPQSYGGGLPEFRAAQSLADDLVAPGFKYDLRTRIQLEKKEDMKKRLQAEGDGGSPDDGDALCFEGSTQIQTVSGPKEISSIEIGETVVTPFGPAQVAIVHKSYTEKLTTAKLSNGSKLCGKPSHEVFTFQGIKKLDALSLTNELESLSKWRLLLWRFVSMSFIGARNSGFKHQAGIISQAGRMRRKDFFIAGCGLTIAALFSKVKKFTTGMGIGETMKFPTSNYAIAGSINGNTCLPEIIIHSGELNLFYGLSRQEWQPRHGMVLPRESNGIGPMGKRYGKIEKQLKQNASDAVKSSTPSLNPEPNSAQMHVCKLSAINAIKQAAQTALSAVRNLFLTATGIKPVVPVSVQTESVDKTLVYNLTLTQHNAYYANGILVFNCLTFAHPVKKTVAFKAPRETYPANMENSWMVN